MGKKDQIQKKKGSKKKSESKEKKSDAYIQFEKDIAWVKKDITELINKAIGYYRLSTDELEKAKQIITEITDDINKAIAKTKKITETRKANSSNPDDSVR